MTLTFPSEKELRITEKQTDSACVTQVQYTAYGEVYLDSNPEFQLVVGFHGGLYDPLTKLVHFTQRDYDVLAGRWTSPDYSIWPKIGKDPSPFNLYMFKNNNPLSDMLDVKNYVTGRGLMCVNMVHMLACQKHNRHSGCFKQKNRQSKHTGTCRFPLQAQLSCPDIINVSSVQKKQKNKLFCTR